MKLVLFPDERLTTKCEPVKKVTPKLKQLAKDMYIFMKANGGVGLSANQIGQNIRLFVADDNGSPLYVFNPQILIRSRPKYLQEGCLSFPGETQRVKRHQQTTIKYLDENGQSKCRTFRQLTAQIVAHEIDHLNGITFHDRVKEQTKGE